MFSCERVSLRLSDKWTTTVVVQRCFSSLEVMTQLLGSRDMLFRTQLRIKADVDQTFPKVLMAGRYVNEANPPRDEASPA